MQMGTYAKCTALGMPLGSGHSQWGLPALPSMVGSTLGAQPSGDAAALAEPDTPVVVPQCQVTVNTLQNV